MSALFAAELLKLRTTRMVYGLLGGLLAIVAIVTVAVILDSSVQDLEQDPAGLFAAPASGIVFVLLLGVMLIAGEFRHGTITQTLLVTPDRWKVLVAKLAAGGVLGLAFGVVSELFALVLGVPLLGLKGADISFDSESWKLVVGVVLASTIAGMLGVGLGSLIRNQVAAIVLVFAWLLIVEPTLGAILQENAKFTPGGAIAAVVADEEDGELLTQPAGIALLLGYTAGLAALGGRFVLSRDVHSIQP
jgi:ABC-2 type transport system permease protein